MPQFWKAARMPDATPRWSAGTAFITAVVLGAEKAGDLPGGVGAMDGREWPGSDERQEN
ncbi:hypothetical protein [Micromonospora zhanjiangensis]|uniref:Uncharacterized protein n=1 Tax=Micromonospora zhanjiangensis TaxID=1522057 RepID=A0ABV8KRL3_9ACTN